MVLKLLNPEQKESRQNICVDLSNSIQNDSKLFYRVITCDESWFFTYDPEASIDTLEELKIIMAKSAVEIAKESTLNFIM